MTKTRTAGVAAFMATVLLSGVALPGGYAMADNTASKDVAVERAAGKLSADGARAYRDLRLARLAIFEAKPEDAGRYVAQAKTALDQAKTDEAVFTKAEADLMPMKDTASKTTGPTTMGRQQPPTDGKPDTQPVAWLPVDGQLVLANDFVATPRKTAAVADANKHVAKGDRKAAIERLKLADVDVNFTMAVVPLVKTTDEVNQAAKFIAAGQYYEANVALQTAENGVRFDVIDVTAMPKAATKADTTATPSVKPAQAPAVK